MVVHGICWGGVGRWAVRLGVGQGRHAGETRQDLQTLGSMTVGGHCAAGLQTTGQWGKGKVSLGLMRDSTGVQQAHYLRGRDGGERDQNRILTEIKKKKIKKILAQNKPKHPIHPSRQVGQSLDLGLSSQVDSKNGPLVGYNKISGDIF